MCMKSILCVAIRSRGMVWMLKRAFYRFRGVTTEAAAALWAYERRYSLRFNRREGVNDDIFDPVGMVTRTAAILVPIAVSHPRVFFDFPWFQWIVVHPAIPQTIRTP